MDQRLKPILDAAQKDAVDSIDSIVSDVWGVVQDYLNDHDMGKLEVGLSDEAENVNAKIDNAISSIANNLRAFGQKHPALGQQIENSDLIGHIGSLLDGIKRQIQSDTLHRVISMIGDLTSRDIVNGLFGGYIDQIDDFFKSL